MTSRGLCGIALVAIVTALALKPAPSLTAAPKSPTRGDSAKFDLVVFVAEKGKPFTTQAN